MSPSYHDTACNWRSVKRCIYTCYPNNLQVWFNRWITWYYKNTTLFTITDSFNVIFWKCGRFLFVPHYTPFACDVVCRKLFFVLNANIPSVITNNVCFHPNFCIFQERHNPIPTAREFSAIVEMHHQIAPTQIRARTKSPLWLWLFHHPCLTEISQLIIVLPIMFIFCKKKLFLNFEFQLHFRPSIKPVMQNGPAGACIWWALIDVSRERKTVGGNSHSLFIA